MYWIVPAIVPSSVTFWHRRLFGRRVDVMLRQPEIEHLCSAFCDHDVRRLQVAMDDSLPVRFVERVGNLDRVLQHLFER